MNIKIISPLLLLLFSQTTVTMNNNPVFPSLQELAAKEIVTSSGDLVFPDENGDYKKYEFKTLPKKIKIQLFEALINKDGYTQRTKDSSLFQQWIQKENWTDETYHFTNVPPIYDAANFYWYSPKYKHEIFIDPYKTDTLDFYPQNSTRQTNCFLYYEPYTNIIKNGIKKFLRNNFFLKNKNGISLVIQNLNHQEEIISVIHQLHQLEITNIAKIIIQDTDIEEEFLNQVIKLLNLEKLQLLQYHTSDNKPINFYNNIVIFESSDEDY